MWESNPNWDNRAVFTTFNIFRPSKQTGNIQFSILWTSWFWGSTMSWYDAGTMRTCLGSIRNTTGSFDKHQFNYIWSFASCTVGCSVENFIINAFSNCLIHWPTSSGVKKHARSMSTTEGARGGNCMWLKRNHDEKVGETLVGAVTCA